ncbi:MAG: glutathione S-transferase family protein [Deltaproteobacteria bacterium]|nr:glutathione S-transferase family protein [Deltaproteobacteria bacterium]
MIKLYHAPLTRSIRIYWLLEELGVPYQLEVVQFAVGKTPFAQRSPYGKVPAIEDGDLAMFESGAILEYVLERYGEGRLAPRPGTPQRGEFLQWVHFAEATAMPPLGDIVRHTIFKPEAERIAAVVEDARGRAAATFAVAERSLEGKDYLLGGEFSAADVMMGVTLLIARRFEVLDARTPNLLAYLARLEARPALQRALR